MVAAQTLNRQGSAASPQLRTRDQQHGPRLPVSGFAVGTHSQVLLLAAVVAGALINIGKSAVRDNDSAPIAG